MKLPVFYFAVYFFTSTCQVPELEIIEQESKSDKLLIGLHALDERTVWASGTGSTIVKTTDGGENWQSIQLAENDSLQFRDIYAFNQKEALVLSAGEGDLSKIFKFSVNDGWLQTYQMTDNQGFLDGLDCWNDSLCLAYGDAIDQLPFILKSHDGGKTWRRQTENLPEAGAGEGGFAASGTMIEMGSNGEAWIGTGAGGHARILHTQDFGNSWHAMATPVIKGEAAGITTVRRTDNILLIAGGDIAKTEGQKDHLFFSTDNGASWKAPMPPPLPSAIYGSALTSIGNQHYLLICGPSGAALSTDLGKSWTRISVQDLWSCELLPEGTGWMVGRNGKIIKLTLP